jgi:hypothetical protein
MITSRFAAPSRARFTTPLAVFASTCVLAAAAAFCACGGSDETTGTTYLGVTDADPPRLGPRDGDGDAGPSPR